MSKPHSLGSSIAIAEIVSSGASLGAVWLLGKHEHAIDPVRDYVATHIVYPCEHCMDSGSSSKSPHTGKYDPEMMKKAKERATLLVKGAIMLGTGFAAHLPTQMAMEGKYDVKEFKKVITGKSLGVGATLATLWLAEKAKPGLITDVEDKLKHAMGKPDCPPGEQSDACRRQDDFCKLIVLDLPSSVLSGLVNYCFARGRAP